MLKPYDELPLSDGACAAALGRAAAEQPLYGVLRTLKWNPILVMCLCGVTNLLIYCIFHI